MSRPFHFVAIYRTNFVQSGHAKIVFHPTKIEFIYKSKTYQTPLQHTFKFPENEDKLIKRTTSLKLDDDQVHIEIMTQTTISDPVQALAVCEKNVDDAVTLLSATYGPHFIDSLVYRGWLIVDGWGVLDSWTLSINQSKMVIQEKTLF